MSYEDYLIGKPQGYPNVTEALCYLTGVSHPIKGSRYNAKNDDYTKIRCTIQEDIFTQYLGKGNDAIRKKSYDATRHNDCPYIVPLGTPRPKRYKVTLEQQTLFEQ
jgi:hypothetical protein